MALPEWLRKLLRLPPPIPIFDDPDDAEGGDDDEQPIEVGE